MTQTIAKLFLKTLVEISDFYMRVNEEGGIWYKSQDLVNVSFLHDQSLLKTSILTRPLRFFLVRHSPHGLKWGEMQYLCQGEYPEDFEDCFSMIIIFPKYNHQ